MTANHLLSTSLFTELFQHNIVSADGRIIANEKQLQRYYSFLVQQSKDRIVSLYKERQCYTEAFIFPEQKNVVNTVQKLLGKIEHSDDEERLLKDLLYELDLKLEEDGEITLKEPKKPKQKFLGPAEPKETLFEREIEAELQRIQVLKRDLRILDDWLDEISIVSSAVNRTDRFDPTEAGTKFRERTKNRMRDMENARSKLIKRYYTDYDRNLTDVLTFSPRKRRQQGPATVKGQTPAQDKTEEESKLGTAE